MELIFNELSLQPYVNNNSTLTTIFLRMLEAYKELKKTYGITHLLFPRNTFTLKVTAAGSFTDWVGSLKPGIQKDLIISHIRAPYSEDIIENEDKIAEYIYENKELNISETYCSGLAICFENDKITMSLEAHKYWNLPKIPFKRIIDNDLNTEDVEVYNISNELISNNELMKKLDNYGYVSLIKSDLSPQDKHIKLSSTHHGNDKLKEFAKKLFQSDYIISVINNAPNSPYAVKLIKNINKNGTIEVVLFWEDAGYTMVLETTGRNYRETKAIA